MTKPEWDQLDDLVDSAMSSATQLQEKVYNDAILYTKCGQLIRQLCGLRNSVDIRKPNEIKTND